MLAQFVEMFNFSDRLMFEVYLKIFCVLFFCSGLTVVFYTTPVQTNVLKMEKKSIKQKKYKT